MAWINKYAAAIQALTAIISATVAIFALYRSIKNQRDIVIHSSPKPFLLPIPENITFLDYPEPIAKQDWLPGRYPVFEIRNVGEGIAIDVSVWVYNISTENTFWGRLKWKYHLSICEGQSILLPNEVGKYDYHGVNFQQSDSSVFLKLVCKSDSGYERITCYGCRKEDNSKWICELNSNF